MKDRNSKQIFDEAKQYMVGGVNSPARSFGGVGGDPLIMKKGEGAKLFDADGNTYTDYCLSWGALICGHAHRNAVLAAKKTAEWGFSFGTTTKAEVEIARHIVECVPSIDRVRFVNSGTEATMSAIRLSRGFTRRDRIIKFDGCYHGHFDDLLTAAGSGVAVLPSSSSGGVPESHVSNTLSLPYNDIEAFEKAVEKNKERIACVIVEPVSGNMGVIPSEKDFLKRARELTEKYKIVLIFDEVMSGFRPGAGGVQGDYGIIPDMTCLGKIIGGGFPVGAYGGREDIMEHLAPSGGVYQAGTFSGNPVVMRTGLATLRLLNENVYRTLNKRCRDFVGEVNGFFTENDLPVHLAAYYSMMSIRFRKEAVRNYKDARAAAGGALYAKLFWHLIERGIYWPPADLEAFFVSARHTKKDLDHLAAALKEFDWEGRK